MKKLMFAAVTAAMVGGVSAAEYYYDDGGKCGAEVEGCAKAYDVTVTLKTTMPKAKNGKGCDACDCTVYYKQGTVKLAGVAWAADADCDGCDLTLGDQFALWSTSTKDAVLGGELNLKVGAYDEKGKKAEAYGSLTSDNIQVMLAGFGTLSTKNGNAGTKCEPVEECVSYVKSLSGNAAGFIGRDFFDPDGDLADCDVAVIGCCEEDVLANAAASGTWKVKYNSSASKKLAKGEDIEDAYKFPKYVDLDDAEGSIGDSDIIIEE